MSGASMTQAQRKKAARVRKKAARVRADEALRVSNDLASYIRAFLAGESEIRFVECAAVPTRGSVRLGDGAFVCDLGVFDDNCGGRQMPRVAVLEGDHCYVVDESTGKYTIRTSARRPLLRAYFERSVPIAEAMSRAAQHLVGLVSEIHR